MAFNLPNLFSADSYIFNAPDFQPEGDINELRGRVKRIVLPDGFNISSFENVRNTYPNLESVSISVRDYCKAFYMDKLKSENIEVRVPKEAMMVQSEKVKEAMEGLIPKYAFKKAQVHVKDTTEYAVQHEMNVMYLAYERASRAWTSDLTLMCLLVTGLEYDAINLSEARKYVDDDVYKVIKEYTIMKRSNATVFDLAHFIKSSRLLLNVFSILKYTDSILKITDNEELYLDIFFELEYSYDIGMKFLCDVEVQKDVFLGFDGTHSLKDCKYVIAGESTPELNMEIIRLTSRYPQRNQNSRGWDPEKFATQEEAKIIPVKPSYIIPEFSFFEQCWFNLDGRMGNLWSYPSGYIGHEGVIKSHRTTVESILTELCYLSKFFKGLSLEVEITTTEEMHMHLVYERIVFKLQDGKIKVGKNIDCQYVNDCRDMNTLEQMKYEQHLRKGEPCFSSEIIEKFSIINTEESEEWHEFVQNNEFYQVLGCDRNEYYYYMQYFMKKNYGWSIEPVLGYSHVDQMVTYLFEIDTEKFINNFHDVMVNGKDNEPTDDADGDDEYNDDEASDLDLDDRLDEYWNEYTG